jgi:hypothetical protein
MRNNAMPTYPVDLHTHTTASDGTYTPTQLVELAAERGLQVLGISDHDTVGGVIEAQAAGERLGVEIVPGIELSTRPEPPKQFIGIHLLGYFINPTDPTLLETVGKVQQARIDQKIKQIEKMQAFGFDLPVEEVLARAGGVPGRPHIVEVLLERNPGKFDTPQQVYDEYLRANGKAHVKRTFSLTVAEAIMVVKQAGGLPVFAHPGAYDTVEDPLAAIRHAHAAGVEGVEVYYPYDTGHRPHYKPRGNNDWVALVSALADELGLLKTGGTDFHGRVNDPVALGETGLSLAQFATLQQGWQKLRVR